ncbi:serine/threonine-protein kinase [Nonomuraea pusilla]|uniref:Serine/threonine protein kinase n=1 Tax=Nonomuraea pusilla TaxID=46177 RepID=A0A1H7ZAY2_9ACTN|nr:serine/threonine-protein kinase [Nonomuraea pusilla]SEM55425.1 Serine/threonine protein kinase [Nonomuraea pusilla]
MSKLGKVGPYTLLERLGRGGMGEVYLASARRGERVALKVLHDLAEDEMSRIRLEREVRALRRVESPYVAKVLDADLTGARPYLVMENIDGVTLLEQVRQHGPLDMAQLLELAQGIAAALAIIHAAGVVHRDLKPGNIIMGSHGPVLIDFGIAQVLDATRLTMTGTFLGTPGYTAPEIFADEPVDASVDVYAWAATVAFAATGRPTFGRGTAEAQMYAVLNGQADLKGVPVALLPLVRAALNREPGKRPTAALLADRLSRLARATSAAANGAAGQAGGASAGQGGGTAAASAAGGQEAGETPPAADDARGAARSRTADSARSRTSDSPRGRAADEARGTAARRAADEPRGAAARARAAEEAKGAARGRAAEEAKQPAPRATRTGADGKVPAPRTRGTADGKGAAARARANTEGKVPAPRVTRAQAAGADSKAPASRVRAVTEGKTPVPRTRAAGEAKAPVPRARAAEAVRGRTQAPRRTGLRAESSTTLPAGSGALMLLAVLAVPCVVATVIWPIASIAITTAFVVLTRALWMSHWMVRNRATRRARAALRTLCFPFALTGSAATAVVWPGVPVAVAAGGALWATGGGQITSDWWQQPAPVTVAGVVFGMLCGGITGREIERIGARLPELRREGLRALAVLGGFVALCAAAVRAIALLL